MTTKKFVYAIVVLITTSIALGFVSMRKSTDPLIESNVDALATTEEGQHYNNAKLIHCPGQDYTGCKGAIFRNCTGAFCD